MQPEPSVELGVDGPILRTGRTTIESVFPSLSSVFFLPAVGRNVSFYELTLDCFELDISCSSLKVKYGHTMSIICAMVFFSFWPEPKDISLQHRQTYKENVSTLS